jgi:hypothetical protein
MRNSDLKSNLYSPPDGDDYPAQIDEAPDVPDFIPSNLITQKDREEAAHSVPQRFTK